MDADQLADWWKRLAPSLRLLASTRCQWGDDCVQEAFIRLAAQNPVPDDPAAWLVRVVRNRAIDWSRSETRRRARESNVANERVGWFEGEVGHALELATRVQEVLGGLTVEQREVVVAHVWTGLTMRQIAAAMDLSLSMVHRQFHEALEHMRPHLVELAPEQRVAK